jgi:hypothetical protein
MDQKKEVRAMSEAKKRRERAEKNRKGLVCQTCGHEFEDIIWENQAAGLAATADEDGIYCGYGSDFDCDVYEWIAGQPVTTPFGIICDVCIGNLLKQGKIVFVKNTFSEIWGKNTLEKFE